jgi:sterol 24-C-methyltransferase
MPFEDNTFDACFAFEATCYGETLEKVYKEIQRVLKPGGVFATYEWLMTPKYNDDNPVHREIRNRIERGSAVPNITNAENAIRSLKAAGLELEREEDRAIPSAAYPVDWW